MEEGTTRSDRPRRITVGRRILRFFFGWMIVLFLLIGSFFAILRLPFVQQYGVSRITEAIQDKTGAEAIIGGFSLSWRGEVLLEEVTFKDASGDTLLHAGIVGSRILRDLQGLLQGRLAITDIFIGKTMLQLRRYPDGTDNLQRFLDQLFPPDPQKKPGNFQLDIRQVRLDDFHFVDLDEETGARLDIHSGRAFIEVECVRFKPLDFEIGKLRSSGTSVSVFIPRAEEVVPVIREGRSGPKVPYQFSIEEARLSGARFRLVNEYATPAERGAVDYGDMEVADLHLHLSQLRFDELHHYQGRIEGVSLREKSGFVLSELAVQSADVTRTGAALLGVCLETPASHVGDSIRFQYTDYRDFLDFNNRVFLEAQFRDSKVAVSDLFYFAPALSRVAIFRERPDMAIQISGFLGSRINNLRGRDLVLQIEDQLRFVGDFGSRNLAVPGEESINLKLVELSTSVASLQKLIPGFQLPREFRKLGKLRYSGRFDGFFVDFVSLGELKTDLGSARMDMRMNIKDGLNKAAYSGTLEVRHFNLGQWTGNPQWGRLGFHSQVRNGKGLSLDNLEAELEAQVDSLEYRGYTYRQLRIDGSLTKDRFEGQFDIRDAAVDFIFEGFVQYRDSLPLFDFRAIINRMDLQRMNLVDRPLQLSAILDFNLRGRDINALDGVARIQKLEMDSGDSHRNKADSLVLRLKPRAGDGMRLQLQSDLADMLLDGEFKLLELPDIFYSRVAVHFPEWVERFQWQVPSAVHLKSRYLDYRLNDRKLDPLLQAFVPRMPAVDGVQLEGHLDLEGGKTQLRGYFPRLQIKDVLLDSIALHINGEQAYSDIDLDVGRVTSGDQVVNAIHIRTNRRDERYQFEVVANDRYPFGTHIHGLFHLDKEGYHISLNNDSLVFVNQVWDIAAGNTVHIDSGFISLAGMRMRSEKNIVEFKDYRGKGLIVHLYDLDLEKLNEYLNYPHVQFAGKVNVDLLVRNLFEVRDFAVMLQSADFMMNGDHYGQLYLTGAMPTLKSPLEIDFELDQLGEGIQLKGKWYHNELSDQGGRIDMAFTANRFPISFAEYFLDKAIVNTRGHADAEIAITGPLYKPEVQGHIDVEDFETVIDYLGVRYAVKKGRVKVSSGMFDATGVVIQDPLDNTAVVTGGMTHDHFRNWGLDCTIRSDQFMALNTRKQDNPYYYGTGIGRMEVQFSGTLAATNIYVRAATARGSSLSIPVSQGGSQVQQHFVEFYEKKEMVDEAEERRNRQIKGLQLEMDVEMTPEAQVQIIFDERTGDILRGFGRGNIRMEIPRSGNLKMFGDYSIERGDYLFTFQNLVNKSFAVERGGTIQWSGDPFDAQINMRTIYTIPSTSVYNLIAEYLVSASPGMEQAARTPTEVQLFMNLSGKLLQPDIGFDLGFPRLFGEVRSLVESKMQNLRRDPNDLNWQVFGLIVANNFLPPGLTRQGTEYVATINTVSEMISNQFSRYITALMTELVADVGIISDVGFDFNYNIYQSQSITQVEQAFTDSKVQVTQRINFFDDRLSLAIEGSVTNTRGIEASSGVLIGGDFQVEYALTPDRRLKMRVYQRTEPTILGNNRYKVGAGLNFRKEFD